MNAAQDAAGKKNLDLFPSDIPLMNPWHHSWAARCAALRTAADRLPPRRPTRRPVSTAMAQVGPGLERAPRCSARCLRVLPLLLGLSGSGAALSGSQNPSCFSTFLICWQERRVL
jgi:hypothetical protein